MGGEEERRQGDKENTNETQQSLSEDYSVRHIFSRIQNITDKLNPVVYVYLN